MTHGMRYTRVYRIWRGMKTRCLNKNSKDYVRYAGLLCERWKMFANFYADMGKPPSDSHSIDRFPNRKGGYEPGNARWATPEEQAENRDMARGEKNSKAKLTKEQAIQVIQMSASGMSGAQISRLFGVYESTANRIISGKSWAHLRGEAADKEIKETE